VILHIVYIVAVVIALVLGAYGIDPRKKYINVVIDILTKVKEVTPDNVDKIIDMIIKGLQAEGLNPESKAAKQLIEKVKGKVS